MQENQKFQRIFKDIFLKQPKYNKTLYDTPLIPQSNSCYMLVISFHDVCFLSLVVHGLRVCCQNKNSKHLISIRLIIPLINICWNLYIIFIRPQYFTVVLWYGLSQSICLWFDNNFWFIRQILVNDHWPIKHEVLSCQNGN